MSPVLTATRIFSFSLLAISSNGVLRFFSISLFNAFSGETYRQYTLSSRMFFSAESTSSFIIDRKAVRVFVAPVGAEIRILFLEWISRTPNFWGREKENDGNSERS